MKKTLTAYLKALSKNKVDVIEDIVSTKYGKFRKLYWLLKNYSDDIQKIEYHQSNPETLEVDFIIAFNSDAIIKELNELCEVSDEIGMETLENEVFLILRTKDGMP